MKKIFILFVFLLPLFLFARIQVTHLRVIGSAETRAGAIKNALIEAVKQTHGVQISSKRIYSKSIKELGISVDGDSSHATSISEYSKKVISEATKGFIRNYSILDSYRNGNTWIVKLDIVARKYKTPGLNPNKRRKMAIIPFEYKRSYRILGSNENGKMVSERFTQSLISKLTQARKFTILDRQNSKYYNQEKSFIISRNSNKDEFLKLGNRLGADYLLIGQLLDYSISNISESNTIGLPETSKIECSSTVSYRILAMATQQIKWSETISTTFDIDENSNQSSAEALVANSTNKIATIILNHILSNIYPPKIIAVTPSNIIINQGGNSIQEGSRFKIYAKGKRLTDPYTHEYLGYEEIEAGEIVISSVKPKVSYAKLLQGKASKGMILRRIKNQNQNRFHSEGEAKTDVKITPSGGVVLPF